MLAYVAGIPEPSMPAMCYASTSSECALALRLLPVLRSGRAIVSVASVAGLAWQVRADALAGLLDASTGDEVDAWQASQDPGYAVYSTSKASILFSKKISGPSWQKYGIRVNTVSPGPTDTPILGDFKVHGRRHHRIRALDRRPPRQRRRHRTGGHLPGLRRRPMDQRPGHPGRCRRDRGHGCRSLPDLTFLTAQRIRRKHDQRRSNRPHPYSTVDISSHAFWEQSFTEREKTFAKLRATDGLTWHEPTEALFPHEETGFWALTRNADIRYASAHADEFCSGRGVTLGAMPVEIQKATTFFLTMDAPEHTRYRRLISMAFTPKQVRKIEEQIKANAARIVDEFIAALDGGEPVDFMDAVAKKLPMQTVSEMIGLPKDQHETVAAAAEAVFGTSDDEVGGDLQEKAVFLMMQLGCSPPPVSNWPGPARQSAGRPDDQHRAGRGRRAQPHRRGGRRVHGAAGLGR